MFFWFATEYRLIKYFKNILDLEELSGKHNNLINGTFIKMKSHCGTLIS